MSRIKVHDVPGGDTITYDLVDEENGYLLPTFNRPEDEHLSDFCNIVNLPCRDGDILINSYPKTGTHWMYEIVTLLTTRSSKVTGKSKIAEMIEFLPSKKVEEISSPRILNTHLKIKYLPQDAFKRKIKMLLVLRNPKDVVVSLFHHTNGLNLYEYNGKFGNFLQAFMRGEVEYGCYRDYLLDWQRFIRNNPDYPILLVYYENLKENLLGQLERIQAFLDLDNPAELLKEITSNLIFRNMKQGKEAAMTDEERQFLAKFSKPKFSFLRKGQIGDWKNHFTVAQNENFDKWWKDESKDVEIFTFNFI